MPLAAELVENSSSLEVDPQLPFLANFVKRALAKAGAKRYNPGAASESSGAASRGCCHVCMIMARCSHMYSHFPESRRLNYQAYAAPRAATAPINATGFGARPGASVSSSGSSFPSSTPSSSSAASAGPAPSAADGGDGFEAARAKQGRWGRS